MKICAFLLLLNYACASILFQYSSWVGKGGKKEKLLKLFNAPPLNGMLKQTSAAITGICPVIYTWKRLLRAEVTLSIKSSWKNVQELTEETLGDTHFFGTFPAFTLTLHHLHADARAHTHTHAGITHPISIPPAQLSTASHSHSLPPSLPAACRRRSVIQPASTYCSRRITQITPLAIAMVSASLSYLFKVSYDPFHSSMGFLSSWLSGPIFKVGLRRCRSA